MSASANADIERPPDPASDSPPGSAAPPSSETPGPRTVEEIAEMVRGRGDFLTHAPWVTREVQAVIQAAIDAWEPTIAEIGRDQLMGYLVPWAELSGPMHGASSLADLLPLDTLGLALARALDLGRLNQTREDTRREHENIVSSLLQTLRIDWRNGVPTENAIPMPPSGALAPEAMVEAVRVALDLLIETLKQPAPPLVPLDAELLCKVNDRIEAAGGRRDAPAEIPDRDVIYEFLAHRLAYRPDSHDAADLLEAIGFHRNPLAFRTSSGLDFLILEPRKKDVPAVVIFRGTEADDLKDIKTDLEFQIGDEHFRSAERLGLRGLLQACRATTGVPPDLTGHSLGGALCQLTAGSWPDLVGDVVTFQSPGLTRLNAFRGNAGLKKHPRPGPHPRVTHYIADEDVVHKAGQRHLAGRTIMAAGGRLDTTPGISLGLGHGDMLLGTHGERERMAKLGLSAHWTPHTLARLTELPHHPTTDGSFHEAVRATVALGLELVQAHLLHPTEPDLLARMIPKLAAQALGEEQVSAPQIAFRLTRRIVRDTPKFVRRAAEVTWKAVRGGSHDEE